MKQTIYLTRYYGIDIVVEEEHNKKNYWIVDANGCDEHFDYYPTEADIDEYRSRVI